MFLANFEPNLYSSYGQSLLIFQLVLGVGAVLRSYHFQLVSIGLFISSTEQSIPVPYLVLCSLLTLILIFSKISSVMFLANFEVDLYLVLCSLLTLSLIFSKIARNPRVSSLLCSRNKFSAKYQVLCS